MGYATSTTLWPSSVPAPAKDLLDRMFTLVDIKDPNIGEKLAHDIFTEDGKFHARDRLYQGSDEIAISRREAWETVSERRHELRKVYVNDDQTGTDLILLGILNTTLTDGNKSTIQFVARALLKKVGNEAFRMLLYEVWAASPKITDF